jgi:hypothetical protein
MPKREVTAFALTRVGFTGLREPLPIEVPSSFSHFYILSAQFFFYPAGPAPLRSHDSYDHL